jgi:hypothetical protein
LARFLIEIPKSKNCRKLQKKLSQAESGRDLMVLFFSLVVVALSFVVALAIAAAASAPHSGQLSDNLSMAFQMPAKAATAGHKALAVRRHLPQTPTPSVSAPSSNPDAVAPPMLFAAGLQ